tara:strand:- start:63 stop:554 length:492 start_codon:yes stop_codon:yes gene_type:complete
MKSFIVLFLLFISNINTAEFTINVGGKGNFKDIINFNDGIERYGIFTSENTFTTNTYLYGSTVCSGGIHMKNETEIRNQYIICKGESQDGHTFIRRHTNVKDFSAGVDSFEYIEGTGPWKELIGAKCTGAFLNMKRGAFLYNVKCEVTEETIKKINEFTKNRK